MEDQINIFVNDQSDLERAYALKNIIKQKVLINLNPNLDIKKKINNIFQKKKLISINNCDQIVIKPYNSKLKFKSLLIFLDVKLEGLRKRIPSLKVKVFIGSCLKLLRDMKLISKSKTICINRGMDIKPIFPTMEQIISGRYLAYGKIDKAIAEENGIKVESKIGYYNYNPNNISIPNSVLLRPTYFSDGKNDSRVSEIIEKIGTITLERSQKLNMITLHPDCKEWNNVYAKQKEYNWKLDNRQMAVSMSDCSTVICEVCSTFFVSIFLQKDIYLISRKISKPIHFRLYQLIKKYLYLIPTVDEINDLETKNYPEESRFALNELKNHIF